jgi:hypothetical protein
MARLFITPREMNFISDLTKEIIKDVNGQVIYYYPISEIKTQAHEVYNEAIEKVFDNPIAVDALVSANFQEETKIGLFGPDNQYKLDVYVHYRDLLDKGIEISLGDYFSFSTIFYEITNVMVMKNIFGQAEHKDGYKIQGTKVRESQFKAKLLGPTDVADGPSGVQNTFVQQRGNVENKNGPTGDKRELRSNGVLSDPLTGPKEISERGSLSDDSRNASSFYDDEE